MAEEKPGLHIDTDWKKQAQEEKRRLAEQEQKAKSPASGGGGAGEMPFGGAPMPPATSPSAAAATAAPTGTAPAPGARQRTARPGRSGGERELPAAGFASLVQQIMTQALFYLGGVAMRGSEPVVDLDMAKYQVDTLGVLEEKTRGNLTPDEQRLLDAALYETRMRYVSVASQYVT
jgi:hypothetical protein